MASGTPSTPEQLLSELPADRREVVSAVRAVIRANLPEGYRETVSGKMLTYCVPLERYPNTYNKQPLGYAALAAQKNYYALYLNCVYQDSALEARLRNAFEHAGKKLDMGKSCIRFRKLDDLPLDAIGELIASTPVNAFVEQYEAVRRQFAKQQ